MFAQNGAQLQIILLPAKLVMRPVETTPLNCLWRLRSRRPVVGFGRNTWRLDQRDLSDNADKIPHAAEQKTEIRGALRNGRAAA